MPKIELELSPDLNGRLANFLVMGGPICVQRSEVIAEAIKDYLDSNQCQINRLRG